MDPTYLYTGFDDYNLFCDFGLKQSCYLFYSAVYMQTDMQTDRNFV